jgi:predicted histidine transporter YuiF (NhaC family)
MTFLHVGVIAFLALSLLILTRRGLVHIDMSFPWFVAIIVLGFLSTSNIFVNWAAAMLGILYPPVAIIFVTIFMLLGLITALLISYSRLRERQIKIVRRLAALELKLQYPALSDKHQNGTMG